MTPGSERQSRLAAKRTADGYRRVPVWVPAADLAALRVRYPGPRGGIDWEMAIAAALRDGAPVDDLEDLERDAPDLARRVRQSRREVAEVLARAGCQPLGTHAHGDR